MLMFNLALFNNDAYVENKNALVFLLVLRVIENFFIREGVKKKNH